MIVFSRLTASHPRLKVWTVDLRMDLHRVAESFARSRASDSRHYSDYRCRWFGYHSDPVGNTYEITGGTRPSNGPNLFHSFGEFGVPTNHLANFLNETALPTSNILGRVTGGIPPTSSGPSKPPASAAPICS